MAKAKNKKEQPDNFDDRFELANACSATECTGLIQVGEADDEELDNYKDIYSFEAPKPPKNENLKDQPNI